MYVTVPQIVGYTLIVFFAADMLAMLVLALFTGAKDRDAGWKECEDIKRDNRQ